MSLGTLKKLGLSEIRKIWPREEKDLSPWIAENIQDLNDELGLQIQIEGSEEPAYDFRIDLVGTDSVAQVPVIIENQFGQSDHDHLGKLITYSAAREAGIVIWVASHVRLAHRNALEWLNTITPQEMTFYGVELEVVQIDDSLPAVNFRTVAGPPPSKRKPPPDSVSPRNQKYQGFFDRLRAKILSLKPALTRAKALPQSVWGVSAGRSGFSVNACFTADSKLRVELYLDTGKKEHNDMAFEALSAHRGAIEGEIGEELVWDALPDSRACRVYHATSGTIDDDEEELNDLIEWAAPLMIRLREAFGPAVKNLQLET